MLRHPGVVALPLQPVDLAPRFSSDSRRRFRPRLCLGLHTASLQGVETSEGALFHLTLSAHEDVTRVHRWGAEENSHAQREQAAHHKLIHQKAYRQGLVQPSHGLCVGEEFFR